MSELSRNPLNDLAEVEQATFALRVLGVGFSPDHMLQRRLFAYADAQRYRVGTNRQQLPVNAPRSPVDSYQRDGTMAIGNNAARRRAMSPTASRDLPLQARPAKPPLPLSGSADRHDSSRRRPKPARCSG